MSLTVRDLVLALSDVRAAYGKDYLANEIVVPDLYRPALELTGYFKFYPKERLQLFGKTEISYINGMDPHDRKEIMARLAVKGVPAFIISRGLEPPAELVEACEANGIVILSSERPTTRLTSYVTNYLEEVLAERKAVHGCLVDINGMGVLITGPSGIGKSETTLDLVKSGHRLVSDDRVDLYTTDGNSIVGESPEVTKHMIEIRGIGVIDVINMYGVAAVKEKSQVELICHLNEWDSETDYNRLGLSMNEMEVFGIKIPKVEIPVSPGRNMANIIETAAMSNRAKSLGYDATEKLMENLDRMMEKNKEKNALNKGDNK